MWCSLICTECKIVSCHVDLKVSLATYFSFSGGELPCLHTQIHEHECNASTNRARLNCHIDCTIVAIAVGVALW